MTHKRQKVLLLVHRIPYPPDKGDKIRSWQLLNFLNKHFDVSLGYFVDDKEDHQHTEYLKSICAEVKAVNLNPALARLKSLRGLITGQALTFPFYGSGKMHNWVADKRSGKFDAEIAFSSSMAPYLADATGPSFVDLVDADSAKWRQYASTKTFPLSWVYAREGRLLAEAEAAISQQATATFLITPEEAEIVSAHPKSAAAKVDWYMNGVDTAYFDPRGDFSPLETPNDLIFSGAMDYWANAQAVIWFSEHVWPLLRKTKPDLTLAIVGARPTQEVQALGGQSGITVTGRVADMRPWIEGATVAIAPLRIARGIQNKVLEAMAMAKPVVASPGAAAGIVAKEGVHFLVKESPEEMAAAILTLLNNPQKAQEMGASAREHLVQTYGWEAQFQRLAAQLKKAGLRIG